MIHWFKICKNNISRCLKVNKIQSEQLRTKMNTSSTVLFILLVIFLTDCEVRGFFRRKYSRRNDRRYISRYSWNGYRRYYNRATHGGWSSWRSYSPCSTSCGGGVKILTRLCNNPAPKNGGHLCRGSSKRRVPCNTQSCQVPVQWSSWSVPGHCSKTCGGGVLTQTRQCNGARRRYGYGYRKQQCTGESVRTIACNIQPCQVQWSSWSNSGHCSKTCGKGIQIQTRLCKGTRRQNGYGYRRQQCTGTWTRTIACNTQPCKGVYWKVNITSVPIDGDWSPWINEGACSQLCGTGRQNQTRRCNNPEPQSGGKPCNGETTQMVDCNTQQCPVPVDGKWSLWVTDGACSQSCGIGRKSQRRKCNNPAPQNGGKPCSGDATRSISCNIQPCPVAVDGKWSPWVNDGACSQSCGNGRQNQRRTCNDPAPLNGGKICSGDATRSITCNIQPCQVAVDGKWSPWVNDGACSQSCGTGIQTQRRTCNNPAPQNGGRSCSGDATRSINCNIKPCPVAVDGKWSLWVNDGACSQSCGTGKQNQRRTCNNPAPQNGGRSCSGDATRSINCNIKPCPVAVDGKWSPWVNDGACSQSCGSGRQNQRRTCNDPAPQNGGRPCSGDATRSINCNIKPCPVAVDGEWSPWVNDGTCSQSCGNGRQTQRRTCNDPAPQNGGRVCSGNATRSINCNIQPCQELPSAECEIRNTRDKCHITIMVSGICQHTAPEHSACPYKVYIYKAEDDTSQATLHVNGTSVILKEGWNVTTCAFFILQNYTLSVSEDMCQIMQLP